MNASEVRATKTSRQLTQDLVKALKLYCEILQTNLVEILVMPHCARNVFLCYAFDGLDTVVGIHDKCGDWEKKSINQN